MKSGKISSQGIKLYYEIHGQGQPMLLLNGGPGFSHEYLEPLKSLADQAKLVFYDQRGTGQSDKANPSTYTIDANVEDLEQLRQQLGLGKCILFGHSWGGILAQSYILKYPQNVSRLILADTFACTADINAALQRMRAAVPAEVRAVYEKYEREGLYKGRDRYPDEYQAALDVAYEPVTISTPPPEYLQRMFSKLAYDVYRAMWGEVSEFVVTGTLAEFDARPRLSEIHAPTLVIVGANDMPTVEMARDIAQRIPNARLEVFERSRHFPFIEETEKFQQIMHQFLSLAD